MGLKLVLNVLYTVGIVLCLFVAYQANSNKNFTLLGAAILVAGVVIVLKIRLLKDVRNSQKKQ
ncbi:MULTISPECIES: DUF6358 family protein [Mucilaginibacter]|uniref:Uncharacterized protein n=1 Tax=Mucilaginibacter lappiensis TaxID=354630 RepID=A0A1N7EF51_9SPHI|nr:MULTISPECIES: DUF6358 family protein [Mucilaginibacter]MBB6111723.1 hypothetical protein [Mucilaginibacter lappiensis]MBB6128414.1 hypothetical protein [Mucilaginibacter lappiensis]NHA07623.1 hypothetical protein [Mucilaginibacter inviolabilis]SIR86649.1 hypothetical protein SAMN05421821_1144 [Mucilaginibacter lappiensis]